MTPSRSPSIAQLIERNEQALAKLNYSPELDLGALRAGPRARVIALLTQREELLELASAVDQRQAYGLERWSRDFVLLGQLESWPGSKLSGNRLRNEIWSQVSSSPFKRFHELFSNRELVIVPHFEVSAAGEFYFPARVDFKTLGVKGCLVSPERVPDKLLSDLGLLEPTTHKTKPLDRLRRKADPEVLESLKAIWTNAYPLQRGHFRIFIIRPPGREAEHNLKPKPDTVGAILYTRDDSSSKISREPRTSFGFRESTVQFFPSAYAAHRKTVYENLKHKGEIDQLSEMKAELKLLNQQLDREWRAGMGQDRKQQLLEQARKTLIESAQKIEACHNRHKLEAHDYFTSSAEFRDITGKRNVSSAMSKLMAGISRLERRLEELYPTGGYNQQDQMVLQRAIRGHEATLRKFRQTLLSEAKNLELGLRALEGGANSVATRESAALTLLQPLVSPVKALEGLFIRPFNTFAGAIVERFSEVEQSLGSGKFERAKDLIVEMHLVGKLYAVMTCFENVKLRIIEADKVTIADIRDFVGELNKTFTPYQVFPERILPKYQRLFESLERELGKLDKALSAYAKKDQSISQRSDIFHRLRTYLDKFDLEAIVREL